MNAADMTIGQLRALCQQCDCQECTFWRVPRGAEKKVCVLSKPRYWRVKFNDRRARLMDAERECRDRRARMIPCHDGNGEDCFACYLFSTQRVWGWIQSRGVPYAWQRILEDERRLMESLLEVKP